RLFVRVGQRQVGRAGLQHVDQVLVEVLPNLHDGEVRTQRRRLGAQCAGGVAQRRQHLVGGIVVDEVGADQQVGEAETYCTEGCAGNVQRGRAGLVEHQLQRVAVQQVDTVERGVLRSRGDLRQNVVVLRNEASAGGLGVRVRDRSGGGLAGKQARAACKCADLLRSVIVVGLNRQVAVG